MALTNPTVVGTVATGSGTHSSDTITTTANIPAGAIVVLAWGANANRTPTSITGTAGLTFQQDAGGARAAGSGGSGWLYSAKASSLISSGATVIVNFTSGTIATVGVLLYFEGADQTTWKDVSTQNAAGSGNWDTGTTASRSQANEISIAMAFDAAASATSSATDGPATELAETSFAGDFVLPTSYEQHASTGTSRITGVWTGGGAWCAAIATYKEAAAAGVTVKKLSALGVG